MMFFNETLFEGTHTPYRSNSSMVTRLNNPHLGSAAFKCGKPIIASGFPWVLLVLFIEWLKTGRG